ncbi:MAG TPA: Crp/Fnr family transcriptional regulator [Phnomibacter sp.]|nr:Crp/Fnr family transcriptional regulator [Phnomibacter sp.]
MANIQRQFPIAFALRFHEMLNKLNPVSFESVQDFLNQFELVEYKKGEVLLHAGEVCRHLYYVIKGGLRCFMHDEDGKEINLHFYFEDELASEFKSLRQQTPSDRNLAALSTTKVLRAARPDYIEFFKNNDSFMQAAFRFFQQMFLEEEEHSEMLRKLSSEEKYQYVLDNHPHLLQKISLTQLASWLGMSRESLSRIRGKAIQ